jgi:hypothetical protein
VQKLAMAGAIVKSAQVMELSEQAPSSEQGTLICFLVGRNASTHIEAQSMA